MLEATSSADTHRPTDARSEYNQASSTSQVNYPPSLPALGFFLVRKYFPGSTEAPVGVVSTTSVPKRAVQQTTAREAMAIPERSPAGAEESEEQPKVTEQPLLLYNWLCPYVQRVTLALAHKQVELPRVSIDLANKPSWLPKYSPHGKVPAITYLEDGKQQVLYESLALVFWVDEYFKEGPQLMPQSPAQRALARIVMARFDQSLVPLWYGLIRTRDLNEFRTQLDKLHTELKWLEDNTHPAGPLLLGSGPSLVDAVIAPWLLRSWALKKARNVDVLFKHPKLQAWLDQYRQLPEVESNLQSPSGVGYDTWVADLSHHMVKYTGEDLDFSAADV